MLKILYGIGPYRGSLYRFIMISNLLRAQYITLGPGEFHPFRWNSTALQFNDKLNQFFIDDVVRENPDLIISDENSYAEKLAKDLSLPILKISTFKQFIQNPLSINTIDIGYQCRENLGIMDYGCLIRDPKRSDLIKSIIETLPYEGSFHTQLNDDFWEKEKKFTTFICEGNWEDISIGLTGGHPIIILPDTNDDEAMRLAESAEKIGIINLGKIELAPKFAKDWLIESIEKIDIPLWSKKEVKPLLSLLEEEIKKVMD